MKFASLMLKLSTALILMCIYKGKGKYDNTSAASVDKDNVAQKIILFLNKRLCISTTYHFGSMIQRYIVHDSTVFVQIIINDRTIL